MFLLSCTIHTQSKKMDYHNVEIRMDFGRFKSVKLLSEGLIYSIWQEENDSLVHYVNFIPSSKIDSKKAYILLKYVWDNDIMEIKENPKPIQKPNEVEFYKTSWILISFIDYYNKFKYSKVLYRYCDKRLDKLIVLLTDLIPENDRKKFRVNLELRCK